MISEMCQVIYQTRKAVFGHIFSFAESLFWRNSKRLEVRSNTALSV